MDLSGILAGVKLKSVATNDKSGPMLKAGLEASDIKQYHDDVLNTYVEAWEPLLAQKKLTFRTEYISIDKVTADFLADSYLEFEKLADDQKMDCESKEETNEFDKWFADKAKDPLFVQLQTQLQAKIDECIQKFGCNKVFVKGSSRSAKDSVVFSRTFRVHCCRSLNMGQD
mmetsp:Transcript_21307/g.42298  ORF Transcript_21307/g.42298 Transcript_21307/m.42298 type:complete len:171 (+) Transcript_21307:59-571(+)